MFYLNDKYGLTSMKDLKFMIFKLTQWDISVLPNLPFKVLCYYDQSTEKEVATKLSNFNDT